MYLCPWTRHQPLYSLPVGHARFQAHIFLWPWIWLPSVWPRRTGNTQENMNIFRGSTRASAGLRWAGALKLSTWADETPMLRFYTYSVLGRIKSREKYARGGNKFPPSGSLSLWSCLACFWNLTTASHTAESRLCLCTPLWWAPARGTAGSRAERDWNTLVPASEPFGQKITLKGGRNLHCGKPGTL